MCHVRTGSIPPFEETCLGDHFSLNERVFHHLLQISNEGKFHALGLSSGDATGASTAECRTHLAQHQQALDPGMR